MRRRDSGGARRPGGRGDRRGSAAILALAAGLSLAACDDAEGGAATDRGPTGDLGSDLGLTVDLGPDLGPDSGTADPYAAWPDPAETFPAVYSPDPDLPNYGHVRWETESWEATDAPAGLYARKVFAHYTTAPPEVMAHFQATGAAIPPLHGGGPKGDEIVISFAGDILWVGDNWSHFGEAVAPMTVADLRVANLETPASTLSPPGRSGLPVRFNSPPEIFDSLPFDVLQLNNNHSTDADDEGILDTRATAEAKGFVTTGIERHAAVDVAGRRVALLSYTWGLNRRNYTSSLELFVVPFGHLDAPVDLSRIEADIVAARAAGARHVVVLNHWGYEFEYYPDPHFLEMARTIVGYGADVVVGEGPHVVQPAEICHVNQPEKVPGIGTCSVRTADGIPRNAAVLYSVGNFSNDVKDRIEVEVGIVAKVSLGDDVTGLGWSPLVLRHDPPRVEPVADHLDDPEVADEVTRLNAHLGAGWALPLVPTPTVP